MTISRRRLLAAVPLLSVAACTKGGANVETESSAGALLTSGARLPRPYTVPLPVPPVLAPVAPDRYEITQKAATAEILPGYRTEVWGYNGIFPGPTIESRRGRQIVVRHTNELPVPTVVHLHGGRTPPEHDGYPTDLVTDAREYVYPLDQRAATLWYHDHRLDFTGPQVYKGLAGFHIVRDDEEDALPLPRGDREIPLMITDRAFRADGSFDYPALDPHLRDHPGVLPDFMSGVLGDCVLVNGAPWPELAVDAARYRFRLLNASNARRYQLALDPGGPLVQIGGDGGLLAAPVAHESLRIAQAERYDVVVDFARYPVGTKVRLVNQLGSGGTAEVMRFVVARKASDDSRVPEKLSDPRPLSRDDVTVARKFTFTRGGADVHGSTPWTINGEVFDPDRMAAEPKLGAVELWQFHALSVAHPIHVHLAPFQVVGRGGGWKDTVDLENGEKVEVLIRFDGYRGRYVFHCHNLEHEDMMMMANFRVV